MVGNSIGYKNFSIVYQHFLDRTKGRPSRNLVTHQCRDGAVSVLIHMRKQSLDYRFAILVLPHRVPIMQSILRAIKKSGMRGPWPAGYFKVPLKDLGDSDERLRGIWTPEPKIGAEKIGISEQFLENAEIYYTRYSHAQYMVDLLGRAFDSVGFSLGASPDVLDIGAGSGKNSILPMLALCGNARFIATDLSPDLLEILRRYSTRESLTNNIAYVCTDAMLNFFVPSRFDVVTGIAILHHLIDPMQAIKAAYSALKPGGVAVFLTRSRDSL